MGYITIILIGLAIGLLGFLLGIIFLFRYINRILVTDEPKHKCTQCGCQQLSPLRSLNVKKCTSCGHEMEWNLDPGQLPLVRSNRMVKKK